MTHPAPVSAPAATPTSTPPRRSRRFKLLVTALALVLILAPALAWAGPGGFFGGRHGRDLAGKGGFDGGPFGGVIVERLTERLDLTPAQVDDIRAILESYRDELKSGFLAVKSARGELFDAIHAEVFDEDAIRDASAAVATAQADLAVTRGEVVQEVRTVLTPAQRQEARELIETLRAFVDTWLGSRDLI